MELISLPSSQISPFRSPQNSLSPSNCMEIRQVALSYSRRKSRKTRAVSLQRRAIADRHEGGFQNSYGRSSLIEEEKQELALVLGSERDSPGRIVVYQSMFQSGCGACNRIRQSEACSGVVWCVGMGVSRMGKKHTHNPGEAVNILKGAIVTADRLLAASQVERIIGPRSARSNWEKKAHQPRGPVTGANWGVK
ncbi:hypothetical protein Nepgr_010728 [Nepenthes gracilis]|uniref:Uncharacterized protein n=1 Tax=Nepenthes gracilis TaxID=150966 RepID=A0AAD3SCY8_NEPGR|nr:hypothetical protein Nepgr_010728 [Nepenthes gracilis]